MDATQLAAKATTWLGVTAGPDADNAPVCAAAVVSWVGGLPIAHGLEAWPDDVELAAIMLTARLIRRRNSPAGIEAFTASGTAYTRREDPDVARMLGLESYARPRIG